MNDEAENIGSVGNLGGLGIGLKHKFIFGCSCHKSNAKECQGAKVMSKAWWGQ